MHEKRKLYNIYFIIFVNILLLKLFLVIGGTEPIGFHKRAGKNIILTNNYKTASRRGIPDIGQAIVFSAQSLQGDIMFEVKVKVVSVRHLNLVIEFLY